MGKSVHVNKITIEEPKADLNDNEIFLRNLKTSLLSALLENGVVTTWQYDRGIEMLKENAGR